jgi:hypothetical protein
MTKRPALRANLVHVKKSPQKGKKLVAAFDDGTSTHFGAEGYGDYTLYFAKEGKKAADVHKERYIARHQVNQDWTDPKAAGTLARYILWNKPTIEASVMDYKKRFE